MQQFCLLLDQDPDHAKRLSQLLAEVGFEVLRPNSRAEARELATSTEISVAFIDISTETDWPDLGFLEDDSINSAELFVMSDDDDPARADEAIRRGASYFFCKPFDEQSIRTLLEDMFEEPVSRDDDGDEAPCAVDQFGLLRGDSVSMRKLYRLLRKVAPTDASIMVIGESGTGKELVAETAHLMSDRSDGPYIAFNCAAIPENLAESELFGHEKGSFSGAAKMHKGYFERAEGGTLLLDEVTEMDLDLQAKLLRVLETKTFRRLGAENEMVADVRVISATNRSPEQAVAEGKLREDLYYRLAQFPLRVPPLRKRGRDTEGLAQFFLNELNQTHDTGITFTPGAVATIRAYSWPGNVRQLKHSIERAYIIADSSIEASTLPDATKRAAAPASDEDAVEIAVGTSLSAAERTLIEATLDKNAGDKQRTADELGISLKTLYNRLRDYTEDDTAAPPANS